MKERFKTFTVLIAKISRGIRKIKTEEMAEFNLKSPHVSCLYYLLKSNTLTAKELCDMCDEDKAAVSRSIDYLESNNYIACNTTVKKRYKSPLMLTDKGKVVAQKVAKKVDAILDEASLGLSEADRLIMYNSLNLISNNIEKICNDYGE